MKILSKFHKNPTQNQKSEPWHLSNDDDNDNLSGMSLSFEWHATLHLTVTTIGKFCPKWQPWMIMIRECTEFVLAQEELARQQVVHYEDQAVK